MSGKNDSKAMTMFFKLRADLFEEIERQLQEDGHCKSYEGCFEITVTYPNYFEDRDSSDQEYYTVSLHCYVVGPHRHYRWGGYTLLEAVENADNEIREWLLEEQAYWENIREAEE